MTDTIANLREIVEPEPQLYSTLKQRGTALSSYENFGPPDVCYLLKEHKGGLLSPTHRAGYFHYVYGVDTSSSASVAVYINNLLKDQEREGWYSSKSTQKVIKAIFCIYDIVLKRDVRVEITFPGGTHVYAIDEQN